MPRTKRKPGQVPVRKRLARRKTHKAKPSLPAKQPATKGSPESSTSLEITNDEPSTSIQDNQSYKPESIGFCTPDDAGSEVVEDQSRNTSLPLDAEALDCKVALDCVALQYGEDPAEPGANECLETRTSTTEKANQVSAAATSLLFHTYAQSSRTKRTHNSSQPVGSSEGSSSHLTSSQLRISCSSLKVVRDISVQCESQETITSSMKALTEAELLLRVKTELEKQLPSSWVPIVDHNGIHVLLLSRFKKMAVQRDIYFTLSGNINLNVHCEVVDIEPYLKGAPAFIKLSESSFDCFLKRVFVIVQNVREMEICSGADYAEYKVVWPGFRYGQVDSNPYQEARYTETMRSLSCKLLVDGKRWRCAECAKLREFLKRRHVASLIQVAHPFTSHNHMTEEQKDAKLEVQRKKLDANRKFIERREEAMKKLLELEGVDVDQELSNDLSEIMKNLETPEPMRLFLEQQVKASQKKNLSGMKWHPTLIRWALSLYQKSPAACESAGNSPFVVLPSGRTLFDYSHADYSFEGINIVVLKSVAEQVDKREHDYQKYFVLIGDEVCISKNLVYRKGSGEIIGYTKLDEVEVDTEVKLLLRKFLEGKPTRNIFEELGKTRMLFTIKGAANGITEVVASFPTTATSANQMYIRFWEIVGALERSGIAVLAFVCDGSTTNRMFIKKHRPFTKTKSGVVFDILNKACPDRQIYFISDAAYLIKAIRNCFKNSRRGTQGKSTRCMKKNGQFIVWDTIMKLYHSKKGTSRKPFKLNAQHVYPDSYSCLSVKLARQVMSRTVAADIRSQKWPHTDEIVTFIGNVNDWFECLSGQSILEDKRKINKHLLPYESLTDPRFDFLQSILDYFDNWTTEAPEEADDTRRMEPANASVASELDSVDLPEDSVEGKLNAAATDSSQAKTCLSRQTLYGIEMTTRSFIAVTRFLLQNGTPFVNARDFFQDPLDYHCSKVRAEGGGSTNPNCEQNDHTFVAGQRGCNLHQGNARGGTEETVLSEQPLNKRRSASQGGPVEKKK